MALAAEGQKSTSFRTVFILIYTSIIITVFVYFGSAGFYESHISNSAGPDSQYYYFLSSFFLLGLIPLTVWVFGFKKNPIKMGLGAGEFKSTVLFALAGLPVMALIAFLSAKNPAFQAEYPLYRGLLTNQSGNIVYWLILGSYYIGWEFYFRGFMLFGLENDFGQLNSILIQTIPSCLAHIGKPAPEIFGSIAAGIVFGWVAFRCRSLWPVLIWHWALGVFLDIFIIYG
jgi:membrane protease YdiL (CAAX protease family)